MHGIIKCEKCGDVIAQCRCLEGHNHVTYQRCQKCQSPKKEMTHPTDPKGRECSEAASSNEAGKVEKIVQDLLLHAGEFPKRDLSAIGRYILSRESDLRKRVESLENQVTYANKAYTDLAGEMRDLDDEAYGKIDRIERQLGEANTALRNYINNSEKEISRLKAELDKAKATIETYRVEFRKKP